MIKVKLVRSIIGATPTQRKTVRALGLTKISSNNELPDNACTMGMIKRVSHLVEVVK
ncbi:MAG: 50S ribosomal protein L30 [Desulfoplanes sp.]